MLHNRPDPFSERFKSLIDLCFGCWRCVPLCPAGIPIPRVMAQYRYSYLSRRGHGALEAAERLLSRYHRYARAAARYAWLINPMLSSRTARLILEKAFGIARDAPIPLPEGGTLDEHFRSMPPRSGMKQYAYFADTYARFFKPSIGIKARRVLNKLGIELRLPPQTDSGITMLEFGLHDELARHAALNVESLFREVERGRRIVCTSPAATLMLRKEYPELLSTRSARVVSESVLDVHELLEEHVSRGGPGLTPIHRSLTLHSSCFSQALGLTRLIEGTLRAMGCEISSVRSECCGIAGSWGLLKKNREKSLEVGSSLFRALGAGPVVSNSETCVLQISHSAGLEALLPLENIRV